MADAAIHASGLRKTYGSKEAVAGIDLAVKTGEVFAFLGPNGAGKTTTTEILEGYRERNGGDVRVLGEDPQTASGEWRQRIGIVLQQSRMHPELSVRETLELFAGYYREPRPIDDTIAKVGLAKEAEQRVSGLSGGQQRRLDVGVALVGDPELLFLDEPTTGFDPSARRRAWDVIAGLRDLGKTVFLTTHYMDEAQVLADRAAIIVGGRIVAQGRPDQLGSEHPTTEIRFRLPSGVSAAELPLDGAALDVSAGFVTAATGEPVKALNELTGWALARGVELIALEVGAPTLEDTYLELTASDRGDEG